ncbi:hypothetical protein [Mucilaginibacter sp. SP1R1]|uniref:hypothetical protein n=1 Tax=Mucilaginibacter sp. SP1R1 TaxID=2723091 RepID=UPI001609A55E|nr:hypothetical protein [Mucilaginibacter sp. SP1R1]MBB6152172.1 hypothetical protein [Mucilaginibacter sp. SP1R1]
MTSQEQIYNWLVIGFQQSPVKFSEVFYYDKSDDQFFSILMTDYFLFDNHGDLTKEATASYSENTLKQLTDRIKRITINDNIVAIPRFGNDEDDYLQKVETFLNLNAINIAQSTIWEVEEGGSINIKITG